MFIYLFWETEKGCVSTGGAEGDRESEAGSALSALHMGLDPINSEIMTWAESKSGTLNQMNHPDSPNFCTFFFPEIIIIIII